MKLLLILMLSLSCLSCMKELEEEPLEKYFNSENQNSFEEFQEVLARIYNVDPQLDLTSLPIGLFTHYEVNNQIQTPTNSFLLADFISVVQARSEKQEMIHYNIRRKEIYYNSDGEPTSKIYDEDLYVPKPMGPSQYVKPLEEEPTVTLHNLKVENYKKSAPRRVVERGECEVCELNIHKISVDIYNKQVDEVERVEWEISTDFTAYLNSDFGLFDGTVSRCNKKYVSVDENQNVFLSQCWVLRDYGVLEENSI